MATHDDNLTAVLRDYDLGAGMVVAADGSTIAQVGHPGSVGCDGLMSALVGPYGDARVTFESLDGQLLPRMWAQGDSFAIVDKPSAAFMVIVFGRGISAIEQYHLSKRVSAAIGERWTTKRCSGPGGRQGPSQS
jgi:hypothetical protein